LSNQKYRFDIGHQFLVFMNSPLLVITASDKLLYYGNTPRTWMLIVAAIRRFCWDVAVRVLLDKVVRYGEAYDQIAVRRNPNEQLDRLKRIEAAPEELQRR
jgi:hypothetical protein